MLTRFIFIFHCLRWAGVAFASAQKATQNALILCEEI
jgi:hypothetical protein